jgi:hypothetical protein
MQVPPPSMDVNTFTPLIRYVLRHTRPDGYTNLEECGQPRTHAALPLGEPAAVGVRPPAIPVAPMWLTFTDDTPPDAPVKIVDATMYTLYSELGGGANWVRQCVTFWNRSLKTVTAIRFSFSYLDAAGALKMIQPIDRFGPFAPGVVVEGIRRGQATGRSAPESLKNCRSFLWAGEPGVNRVAVTSVEFEDHSTWPPGSATVWPAPQ